MQQHSDQDGSNNPKKPTKTTSSAEKKGPEEHLNLAFGLASGVKVQLHSICNVTDSSAPSVTHPGESRPNSLLLLPDTKFMAHFLAFHLSDTDKGVVDMHRI